MDADGLLVRIREANWDIRAHVERDPALQGMATTFTGIFLSVSGELLLAHTGDSRAYLLRDGEFTRETRDDSYVQALVDHGIIPPEAAQAHPRRNIITASLGGAEGDVVSVAERPPVTGDRWVLCSDGLTDYVPRLMWPSRAEAADPRSAAAAAVALALEAGTRDNVTVVVCDVVDDDETAGTHPCSSARQPDGSPRTSKQPDSSDVRRHPIHPPTPAQRHRADRAKSSMAS